MHKSFNWLKTLFLMGGMTLLLMLVGNAVGGASGMGVAFLFAFAMNMGAYWFSDRIALAANRARPLPREEAPWLYEMVERLAQRANIPPPPLYVIPTQTPNAFATGRNPQHAAVAVTEGIMRLMDRRELEGVLAHELSHVVNRDTLTMSIVATLAGAITAIGNVARWGALFGGYGGRDDERRGGGLELLFLIIVAPLAALLIQLAISRRREYAADESGAQLTGDPNGLADALEDLEKGNRAMPFDASPTTAPLYIVNHLSGGGFTGLFSTHPPIEDRVARLREMATVPSSVVPSAAEGPHVAS
jgi:heat shock protein HtpX